MTSSVRKTRPTESTDFSNAKRGRGRAFGRRATAPLAELRVASGKTQVAVARESGLTQSAVSQLENRDDIDVVTIATLRKYAEAIGGKLDLVVRFPNGASMVIEVKGD